MTRVMHLHCQLRSIKKASLSMPVYTMQVKEICDLLVSCGNLVLSIEQITKILNGLRPEYDPFVVVISTIHDSYTADGAVSNLVVSSLEFQIRCVIQSVLTLLGW
ncbi:hypothetical protein GQ457_13G018350 [Hibiscus cannabinus]